MRSQRKREILVIAALTAATLAFLFWMIPAAVPVAGGFGSESEMSPRFVPRLAGVLMLAVLAMRSVRLALDVLRGRSGETDPGTPLRVAGPGVIAICLVFAFVGVEQVGFYVSAAALIVLVMLLLGERRLAVLALTPAAVVLFIYQLFERVLGIGLPHGALVASVLKRMGG